jgi:Protein of unknown function (DUF3089)
VEAVTKMGKEGRTRVLPALRNNWLLAAVLALVTPLGFPLPAMSHDEPPAPDFGRSEAWLALPGHANNAEQTPAGVALGDPKQRDRVDVFFIHPTTDLKRAFGNASYDAGGEIGGRLENGVLRFQASVLNGCCRIYAPHYRQASLGAITSTDSAAIEAIDVAYSDVLRAFDYFIAHYNNGKPFIIASHSQGSIHAMRLLQERIAHTPLADRMIAAYVIGSSLPEAIAQKGLPVCPNATSLGCIVDWNSVREGHDDERRREKAVVWWDGRYQAVGGRSIVCVNPLNWAVNGSAPASANLGSIYSDGREAPVPAPIAQVTGASCQDGLLGVNIPLRYRRHFSDVLTLFGVYHDFDYSLFYMNIRANVDARVREYFAHAHR